MQSSRPRKEQTMKRLALIIGSTVMFATGTGVSAAAVAHPQGKSSPVAHRAAITPIKGPVFTCPQAYSSCTGNPTAN
jgi:hypothetical protein